MTTLDEVRANHMGFGWYIRRCPDSPKVAEFWGGVLRIPLIRGYAPTWFFWAGEELAAELISDVPPRPERDTDPGTVSCAPVFRAHGLDGFVPKMKAAGARIVSDITDAMGREVWVLDSDDQLMALRERPVDSTLPGDAAARARRARGEIFNPGCTPMPPHLQDLGWIVRRVTDVAASAKFYAEVFGFESCGTVGDAACFDFGNGVILELKPGGRKQRIPENRVEVTNTWVHRIVNHDLMRGWLAAKGTHLVGEKIQFNSAELTYVLDPDNHITGFEERYDPSRFRQPRRPFLEDLEADRRWAARRNR